MKTYKSILSCVIIGILLALCGCAHYRPLPLSRIKTSPLNVSHEHIAFAYQVFDLQDCLMYLDRDVLSKGYQPINITFTNNTDKFLYLSKSNFSFPYISSFEVAQSVHTSTVKRVVGYGVVGLFIWPFLIPAIVDGVGSADANQKLDLDFKNKTLHNQTIPPYTSISGLVFVSHENFSPDFSLTLVDTENKKRFTLTTYTSSICFEEREENTTE